MFNCDSLVWDWEKDIKLREVSLLFYFTVSVLSLRGNGKMQQYVITVSFLVRQFLEKRRNGHKLAEFLGTAYFKSRANSILLKAELEPGGLWKVIAQMSAHA